MTPTQGEHAQTESMRPKFGDLLRNTMASESNPRRDAYFIREVHRSGGGVNPGRWFEMTDGKGETWLSNPQNMVPAATAQPAAPQGVAEVNWWEADGDKYDASISPMQPAQGVAYAELPTSYTGSVLSSGRPDAGYAAKVTFTFNSVADAEAWHEAIIEPRGRASNGQAPAGAAEEKESRCANCGKPASESQERIADYPEEGEWFCSVQCKDQHEELDCPHLTHGGYRHPAESERLIACEAALRSLASWLGVGGYNSDSVDAKVFEEKIRWGVEHLLQSSPTAQAAPAPTHEQIAAYLEATGAYVTNDASREAAIADAVAAHEAQAAPAGAVNYVPFTAGVGTTQGSWEHGWNACMDAVLAAAPTPAAQADSVPKAQFDDPKVQAVYAILCDDAEPPEGEHWEGFAARRIVDALSADSVLEDAADPLQGAANWLAEAHGQFSPVVLSGCLMIGYNRAKRLHDAALAARKQGDTHDNH